ncbi:hypothetical protein BACOVA_01479 [Bacteroides ovatus ATCC 8483]|uniref:Uncharacterized protein n=1 Tax=Bacteroides ovatus (strain ATCC 8483 / DSM 1896 / JCM 5824 / BCRC 10623 / CCUG 4943 / NCTC 11153) TaxID=411476 RepID=A0AAN3ABR1_BACO1|nr:hypothetical protein BACOVA_01479 [Bacteroides ovatus ATCC 8483]
MQLIFSSRFFFMVTTKPLQRHCKSRVTRGSPIGKKRHL